MTEPTSTEVNPPADQADLDARIRHELLARTAPVFYIGRDGAGITRREALDAYVICGQAAVEAFNPRRIGAIKVRNDIEFHPGAIYRIHTGLLTENIHRLVREPYQTTMEAVKAAGLAVLRMDVDPATNELLLYVSCQSQWKFDTSLPLIELYLSTPPHLRILGDEAEAAVPTEPGKPVPSAPPVTKTVSEPKRNGAPEANVGRAISNEVSDDKLKEWLKADPKAAGQVVTPVPPPPVGTVPAGLPAIRAGVKGARTSGLKVLPPV